MIDVWTIVRFLHIVGAIVWVGGQLTVSLVLMPAARRRLGAEDRTELLTAVGRRFAVITVAVFLPWQVATGWALAVHHDVGWADLLEPGYGQTLSLKLGLFVLVMALAAAHGIAQSRGRPRLARASSAGALIASLAIVLVATVLAESPGIDAHEVHTVTAE